MNAIFHYYTLHYLARRAGFDLAQAEVLAYASQYVDNAIMPYQVTTPAGLYAVAVTHHFGFWDSDQEQKVWMPFHFMPGDPEHSDAQRLDGRRHRLNVTPNNARAKALLVEALRSRDLYRIGIALHTFADTWAHQNFTGTNDDWNRIDANSPIPPVGHAQVGTRPDSYRAVWWDPRLMSAHRTVNNRRRFLAAAKKTYRYLCTYNGRSFLDEEFVIDGLMAILGPEPPAVAPSTAARLVGRLGDWSQRYLGLNPFAAAGAAVAPTAPPGSGAGATTTVAASGGEGAADAEDMSVAAASETRTNDAARSSMQLVTEFIVAESMPAYDKLAWKADALQIDRQSLAEAAGSGDKIAWLRNELLARANLRSLQPVAPHGRFEESHLYRWSEAAKEHLAAARQVLSDVV